jgi:hypothetical protein
MRIVKYASRLLIGLVFIFSGTVKAIDPLGTVYKLQDYFSAFNLDFLIPLSLLFTILLCTCEFLAGFSVLFNIRQKTGIWISLILMGFFTSLTLILAITNPVSDCGCFGDVIKLTNWQTFIKNIIILIPAIYLFITRNTIRPHSGTIREWTLISIASVIFIAFMFYNLRYLPIIDFLPYKTGTHLPDQMLIPEGKPADKYETTFIYEKHGQMKEFTLENYPAGDTAWKFIEQKSVLISKGYKPPVHDFSFYSLDGIDRTSEILESEGYILLMISKRLSEADPDKLEEGFKLGQFCMKNKIGFFILTASGREEAGRLNSGAIICLGDETTLKTMVRADPGYILIKGGTIRGKWSWANLPDKETFKQIFSKP